MAGCALAVSGVLMWLNLRAAGLPAAAAGTLGVCLAIVTVLSLAFGTSPLTRQAALSWAMFLLVPSAGVLAVSRAGALQARPWALILVGPVAFLLVVVAVMVAYNVVFASPRSR